MSVPGRTYPVSATDAAALAPSTFHGFISMCALDKSHRRLQLPDLREGELLDPAVAGELADGLVPRVPPSERVVRVVGDDHRVLLQQSGGAVAVADVQRCDQADAHPRCGFGVHQVWTEKILRVGEGNGRPLA